MPAALEPPIQTAGCGRRAGRGPVYTSVNDVNLPSSDATSAVHSRRIAARCSEVRSPRSAYGTPDSGELTLGPTHADAEHEPAAAELVDGRRHAGDEERAPGWLAHQVSSQAQPESLATSLPSMFVLRLVLRFTPTTASQALFGSLVSVDLPRMSQWTS